MSYIFAILKNENEEDHQGWLDACIKSKNDVIYKVIDLTNEDWLEEILSQKFDIYLARPPGAINYYKQLYDERIYILNRILGKHIYPTYEEILIYENKRMLSYWLKALRVPHPQTWIFYNKENAIDFSNNSRLPIVGKTAIGAGSSGVQIFKNRGKLKEYINNAFSERGVSRTWGPNLRKGDITRRAANRLKNIPKFIKHMKNKRASAILEPQKWYVILQEYVKCDHEWRCIRIGDSFFGHKKLAGLGGKISGTSRVNWDCPPEKLLNFVKEVTDKRGFLSQAVDIFEPYPGEFLVNELQCFWGSKNPHQMILGSIPGRYIMKDKQWVFEEGFFNSNNSYDLRLDHVLKLLKNDEFKK